MLSDLWGLLKAILESGRGRYLLIGVGVLVGGFFVDTGWGPSELRFFYHGGWGTDFYRPWLLVPLLCGIGSLLLSSSMPGAWVALGACVALAVVFAITKAQPGFQDDPWPLLTWLSYRTAWAASAGPVAALFQRWMS
jgi:hypothetical protein